ncbi:MAG: hypothetical protein VX335_01495 [Pseudomonadota bacterium]|nr:hypothetical protein [Pseudomonadota bacterium]
MSNLKKSLAICVFYSMLPASYTYAASSASADAPVDYPAPVSYDRRSSPGEHLVNSQSKASDRHLTKRDIKELERKLNVNSPTSSIMLGSLQDKIAYGGNLSFIYEKANPMSSSSSDTEFLIRSLQLYTDVIVNDDISFHMMLASQSGTAGDTSGSTQNNIPLSNVNISGSLLVDEAYLTFLNDDFLPFYIKSGKSYGIFGNYTNPYANVYSINQSYVQAKNINITFGYASQSGVDFSVEFYKPNDDGNIDHSVLRLDYTGDLNGRLDRNTSLSANISYVDNYSTYAGQSSSNNNVDANTDASVINLGINLNSYNYHFDIEYFKANDIIMAGETTSTAKPKVISLAASYDFLLDDVLADVHFMYEIQKNADNVNTFVFMTTGNEPNQHFNLGLDYNMNEFSTIGVDYHTFTPINSSFVTQRQYIISANYKF